MDLELAALIRSKRFRTRFPVAKGLPPLSKATKIELSRGVLLHQNIQLLDEKWAETPRPQVTTLFSVRTPVEDCLLLYNAHGQEWHIVLLHESGDHITFAFAGHVQDKAAGAYRDLAISDADVDFIVPGKPDSFSVSAALALYMALVNEDMERWSREFQAREGRLPTADEQERMSLRNAYQSFVDKEGRLDLNPRNAPPIQRFAKMHFSSFAAALLSAYQQSVMQ